METSDARKRRQERQDRPHEFQETDLDRLELDAMESYRLREEGFAIDAGDLLGLIGTLRRALAMEERALAHVRLADGVARDRYATALKWARLSGELAADKVSLEIRIEDVAANLRRVSPGEVTPAGIAHELDAIVGKADK